MDEANKKIRLYNRDSLLEKFKNGKRPDESDFKDLINSTINKLDDGISKGFETGLELAPQGEAGKDLISLYERLNKDPAWRLSLEGEKGKKHLGFGHRRSESSLLTLGTDDKVGINVESPQHTLDVGGTIAAKGRIGSFAQGKVPADGGWKTILEGLEGVQGFEITAVAQGLTGKGKYAIAHAIAVNAYNGRWGRVKKTENFYGWRWWHRLRFRWTGNPFNYNLEVKTASDYGQGGVITYHIGTLL